MISQLQEAAKLPDLRQRMLFMLWGFLIFIIGRHIPLAQVNRAALENLFGGSGGSENLFGMLNMFSGGALKQFSIFALGVMPYINASIMMQLMTVAMPQLKKLAQEGEHGRKVMAAWTRWMTVGLAFAQGFGLTQMLRSAGALSGGVGSQLGIVMAVAAGTMFLLWLGEQITDKGIGNGVSLIIFIGIMVSMPGEVMQTLLLLREGSISVFSVLLLAVFVVGTIMGIIFIQQGERQIRVQYARRVVGTRMMGGASTYLPMKVNQAGVMPIIFAISVALFPRTIVTFIPSQAPWFLALKGFVDTWLTPNSRPGAPMLVSLTFYFILVVAFTFFYTAVTYDPVDVADNLKKYGGQIKGIRAGSETARYIDRVLTRITFAGALFLGILALLPYLVPHITGVTTIGLVGGTSLLIVIGVAMETMQQIEAHLLMRHYKGFIG
ncbi:MAG: preprotein translocase subunit SecY [Armatimonadetes bacterium]|nr:preprotein translocase subunit SecY [Armatimonadota bacterium]